MPRGVKGSGAAKKKAVGRKATSVAKDIKSPVTKGARGGKRK